MDLIYINIIIGGIVLVLLFVMFYLYGACRLSSLLFTVGCYSLLLYSLFYTVGLYEVKQTSKKQIENLIDSNGDIISSIAKTIPGVDFTKVFDDYEPDTSGDQKAKDENHNILINSSILCITVFVIFVTASYLIWKFNKKNI